MRRISKFSLSLVFALFANKYAFAGTIDLLEACQNTALQATKAFDLKNYPDRSYQTSLFSSYKLDGGTLKYMMRSGADVYNDSGKNSTYSALVKATSNNVEGEGVSVSCLVSKIAEVRKRAPVTGVKNSSLYYVDGPDKGKALTSTGFVMTYGVCFKGNPWAARKVLAALADEDTEKDKVRVWYNKPANTIEFSYVDTNCMDDSLDATESDCTSEATISECK